MRRHSRAKQLELGPSLLPELYQVLDAQDGQMDAGEHFIPVGCWQRHPPVLAQLFISNSKRYYLWPKCKPFHDAWW